MGLHLGLPALYPILCSYSGRRVDLVSREDRHPVRIQDGEWISLDLFGDPYKYVLFSIVILSDCEDA